MNAGCEAAATMRFDCYSAPRRHGGVFVLTVYACKAHGGDVTRAHGFDTYNYPTDVVAPRTCGHVERPATVADGTNPASCENTESDAMIVTPNPDLDAERTDDGRVVAYDVVAVGGIIVGSVVADDALTSWTPILRIGDDERYGPPTGFRAAVGWLTRQLVGDAEVSPMDTLRHGFTRKDAVWVRGYE